MTKLQEVYYCRDCGQVFGLVSNGNVGPIGCKGCGRSIIDLGTKMIKWILPISNPISCLWDEEEPECWETSCKNSHIGPWPDEYGYIYCYFCSKKITFKSERGK